jgi:hypothetical protein
MDVAVAKELLRNRIPASHELDTNADKIPVWEAMLAKMPEYMIDDKGIIKEWLTTNRRNDRRVNFESTTSNGRYLNED